MSHDLTTILMAQLFDVTSDAIIVIDAEQHIVRFNRGAEKLFGYAAAEVTGHSLDVLLPEQLAHVHKLHVQQFGADSSQSREMGERQEIRGRHKDGNEFPAAAGISKLQQDGRQLFAVILRDITKQRRLEQEVRAKSAQAAVVIERNRLVHDLHDTVTQSLFSASLMAEVLPQVLANDQEKGLAQLQDIRQLTRSALAEMRMLLLELRPCAITDGKLGDLLQQLADATSYRSGIRVTVTADEQCHLPSNVQITFYRIAQEALHNISKHSRAKEASVHLSLLSRDAMLLVHDDGCGFEFHRIGATHLGLRIMQERAEEVGAALHIESAPGQWHRCPGAMEQRMTNAIPKHYRILLVDDHAMVRKGLASMLSVYDDMQLAGEAADGEIAALVYEHVHPDVVLMDMMMPHMDGVSAIAKIRERHPDAKIIALTSFDSDDLVQRALQAGAIGYLLKNASARNWSGLFVWPKYGKRTLSPEAADSLVHLMNQEPTPGHDLTEREREVLALMVEGLNNNEIAQRIFLSISTVKFHVSAILSKLGVTNRIEAVVLAVEYGLGKKARGADLVN